MARYQEALGVLKGLQIVTKATVHHNKACLNQIWSNSSLKEIIETNLNATKSYVENVAANPGKELEKLQYFIVESKGRIYVVFEGIKQLATSNKTPNSNSEDALHIRQQSATNLIKELKKTDPANLDISSITLKELEQILSKHSKDREINLRTSITKKSQIQSDEVDSLVSDLKKKLKGPKITVPTEKIEQVKAPKVEKDTSQSEDKAYTENVLRLITGTDNKNTAQQEVDESVKGQDLSNVARQRKVPSTRIGRLASFGGLFAGLGVGTLAELTKSAVGLGGATSMKEALLSQANAERIVDTLCKVRGAALKIGQILSIQDSTIISPQLIKAFDRVRQAADYMPDWQVNKVMTAELGSDWRKNFRKFEDKPFAAASIGQVHRAVLDDGMEIAIKIQYPGVAQSIESDIDNLIGMLKIWNIFPKGFFIDNVVKVAKHELNWEVDYIREAEYTEKFKEMISEHSEYYVPTVIKKLSTQSVLTTEFVPGLPLDKCFDMSYEHRKFIAEAVLKLCLRELFQLQCMQTDPNWSNFLYDPKSKKLMLIDFGSTRFYPKEFMKNYREVIIAAANNNPEKVLQISKSMKFLTGYETKQMEEAHTNAVMVLGEIFRLDEEFDFGKQKTTEKIAQLVPTMVAYRLCPPPEEIYSIHRKLSGVFLLCSKLKVKMNCRRFYEDIVIRNANV